MLALAKGFLPEVEPQSVGRPGVQFNPSRDLSPSGLLGTRREFTLSSQDCHPFNLEINNTN